MSFCAEPAGKAHDINPHNYENCGGECGTLRSYTQLYLARANQIRCIIVTKRFTHMPGICKILRKRGFCNQADCARQHPDVCSVCDKVRIIQDSSRDQHCLSRKHLRRAYEKGVIDQNQCSICTNAVFQNQVEFLRHYTGQYHLEQARAQRKSPYAFLAPTALRHCRPCSRLIQNQSWSAHLSSAGHRQKTAKAPVRTNTSTTEPVLSDDVELGYVSPDVETAVFRVQVRAPEDRDGLRINEVGLFSRAQSA